MAKDSVVLLAGASPPLLDRAERVLQAACDRGLSLASAESCTGGLVAAILTDIEGCSHAFKCAIVAYAEAAKTDLLGVAPETLDRHGAVSEPVAMQMAEGALARSGASIAVSVTGYAGPTGGEGEEGRVHFALARRGEATTHLAQSFGPLGRDAIREACLATVLTMLEEAIG